MKRNCPKPDLPSLMRSRPGLSAENVRCMLDYSDAAEVDLYDYYHDSEFSFMVKTKVPVVKRGRTMALTSPWSPV